MKSLKARVYDSGHDVQDLIPELLRYGIKVYRSELSNIMRGRRKGKKAGEVITAADKIISNWERKKIGHATDNLYQE